MLKEYLLKKTLDYSFDVAKDVAKRILTRADTKLLTTRDDIEHSLSIHLNSIENWSGEVSFADLKRAKRTMDVFIDLDLYVYPRRVWMQTETAELIHLKNIFESSPRHVILLGQPGAGKTTSMKYLCRLLLHDEHFHSERFSFPLVVRLRDLNQTDSSQSPITDALSQILGLRTKLPEKFKLLRHDEERREVLTKLLIVFLEHLRVLLVLDGFDEVASAGQRNAIIKEVMQLATHLTDSTFILTSRTGDFNYRIENSDHYEISPLDRTQILTFAEKWLGDDQKATDFLTKIYKSPFADTAIRPLTLAHLCAIYDRIKDIPEKPKTIYKKIINLLLEEWDQQRNIKRVSKYAHFEIDRKYEFLCNLSYVLTKSFRRTAFSSDHLLQVYRQIYDEYGLGQHEAQQVVAELETHSGLFLQAGYDEFEFAHKSLQEFLTAEYLVKLPTIPDNWNVLRLMPNELAIAVAISSSSSRYFVELVLRRFTFHQLPENFVRTFLNRLLLEKPDFRMSIWVDLAMLVLYSLYLENNVIGTNQMELFRLDVVFSEFEKIIEKVRPSSIDIILRHYKNISSHSLDDDEIVFQLGRDETPTVSEIAELASDLPAKLYARRSLLLKFAPSCNHLVRESKATDAGH